MNQFCSKLKFTAFYKVFADLSILWQDNFKIEFIYYERVEWIELVQIRAWLLRTHKRTTIVAEKLSYYLFYKYSSPLYGYFMTFYSSISQVQSTQIIHN